MDNQNTVFYLRPLRGNKYALDIVQDPLNKVRACEDPRGAGVPCMRIGLDQKPNNPPWLASFGRRHGEDDVILGNNFSRSGQCYFDFNTETGELLLHDTSRKGDTQLYEVEYVFEQGKIEECMRQPQILGGPPRQCAVLLTDDPYTNIDRQWIFKMRNALFLLIPPLRPARDEDEFARKKLEFADQCASNATQGITELNSGWNEQPEMLTTTLPSTVVSMSYNLRYKGSHQPKDNEVIRHTRLGLLGVGGQGEVHKVVNMYDGNHYACKTIAVRENVPELCIHSEADFRNFIEREVALVKKVHHHKNIVPYLYTQGFKFDQDIEIFMPIYEGNLQGLLETLRPHKLAIQDLQDPARTILKAIPENVQDMTAEMLRQILDALNFVHTYQPQIIHGDVKPENILYHGNQFLLTDFGLAQVVDRLDKRVGTMWFMAPELHRKGVRTPKVDIYALGVTVAECLFKLPLIKERKNLEDKWRELLYNLLSTYAPHYASMLAEDPQSRPTSQEIADSSHLRPKIQNSPDTTTINPSQNLEPDAIVPGPYESSSTRSESITSMRCPEKMEWKYSWAKSISHAASSANS
ncbi:kinase-like protein [Xylaria flabelliformis]|nr:kinase-like protein [Xylaria flabelliformis]